MIAVAVEIARELGRMIGAWLAARPRIRSLAIASAAVSAVFVAWSVVAAVFAAPAPLPLATVTGSVTLDGKPLSQGIVMFAPDARRGGAGPTGEGVIDATGRYRITTIRKPGAVVGAHRVAVVAIADLDPSQAGDKPRAVPAIYARPETSGLTCDVQAGIRNTFDIAMVSPPPEPPAPKTTKKRPTP